MRREDLYDSGSDRGGAFEPGETEEDAELRAELNARLSSLISLNLITPPAGGDEGVFVVDTEPPPVAKKDEQEESDKAPTQTQAEAEEAEFAFRLFSTSAPSQTVVLASKDQDVASGEDVAFARRPISHYVRGELSAQEKEQFQLAAISAQDVLAAASQRAWGLEVPWRVTKITVAAKKGAQPVVGPAVEAPDKRKKTRPGKKRRIVLRIRDKKKQEEMGKKKAQLEKRQSQMMSKEEHMREKRKRLNRERKLKRRQKEKEKKAAAGIEGGNEDDGKSEAGSDASE